MSHSTYSSFQHLDPSPMELLTQFISMTPDNVIVQQFDLTNNETTAIPTGAGNIPPPNTEGLRLTRKQMALKLLALKVATWLKWNLDVLEKNLSIPKQLFLLRDLCTISFGKCVGIPLTNDFQAQISKTKILRKDSLYTY